MSIAKAGDSLKDGSIWKVGDGNMIDIWWDYWGVEGLKGDSIFRSFLTNNEKKVKDQ